MKIKTSVITLLLCVLLVLSSNVHAKEFSKQENIAPDKTWTIQFTHAVKFDDLTKSGIVVKDSSGKSVPVKLQPGKDKKTILVLPPEGGYKKGESYVLSLDSKVRNANDVKLKRNITLNFTIKNDTVSEKDSIFGNTFGNSINNSWVSEDDSYVYLICGQNSSIFEGYIAKFNKSTKELTKLTKEEMTDISDINVVKDNIYYKAYEEDVNHINQQNSWVNNVYKVSTNGENNKKILEGVEQYIASDKNIYFVSMADNYKLCRTDVNGQNKTIITEDPVEFFNIVGDKIVYTKRTREEIHAFNSKFLGAICRVNLDGTNKTVLTENEAHSIITVDNEVYYINYSDYNKIYKVSLDGSKNVKISDNRAEYMNIQDGWIYFANESVPKTIYVGFESKPVEVGTLHKMKIDGTETTKLKDEYFRGINLLKDAVYYNLYFDSGSMNGEIRMRVEKDGQNSKQYWKYLNGEDDNSTPGDTGNTDSVVKLDSGIIKIATQSVGEEYNTTVMDMQISNLPSDIKNKAKKFILITTPYDYDVDGLKDIAKQIPDRDSLNLQGNTHFEQPDFSKYSYATVLLFDENNNFIAYYTTGI